MTHRYTISLCDAMMHHRDAGATGSLRAAQVLAERALWYQPAGMRARIFDTRLGSYLADVTKGGV